MNPTEKNDSAHATENTSYWMDKILASATRVPVIILLGPSDESKSSLIENASCTTGRSDAGSEPVNTACKIAGTLLDGKEYFFIDTPSINDEESAQTALCQLMDLIADIQHNCVFVGVWYVTDIRTEVDESFDAKFCTILSAFCSEKFFPYVTFVTTLWNYAASERLQSLETRLRQRKERWRKFLNKGAMTYEHGKISSQQGKSTSTASQESMKSALQDQVRSMVLRNCRNPRGVVPRFVQEISQGVSFEDTAVALVVDIFTTLDSAGINSGFHNARPTNNPTSSSSEQQESSNQAKGNARNDSSERQKPSQGPPEPERSGSEDNTTSNQSNLDIDLQGVKFSTKAGGLNINVGFSWPWNWPSEKAPSKTSTSNPNRDSSLVDFCKRNGLPSDFKSREKMGRILGIDGEAGSAAYNIRLMRALSANLNAVRGKL